jgi:hypothetical protein
MTPQWVVTWQSITVEAGRDLSARGTVRSICSGLRKFLDPVRALAMSIKLGARSDVTNKGSRSCWHSVRQKKDWPGRSWSPANQFSPLGQPICEGPRRLEAAETPEAEPDAAAAAATAATATAAAATPVPAPSAAETTATPRHLLRDAAIAFLVEQMECRQADVRDFLFT